MDGFSKVFSELIFFEYFTLKRYWVYLALFQMIVLVFVSMSSYSLIKRTNYQLAENILLINRNHSQCSCNHTLIELHGKSIIQMSWTKCIYLFQQTYWSLFCFQMIKLAAIQTQLLSKQTKTRWENPKWDRNYRSVCVSN
jgi:hypothetical protein